MAMDFSNYAILASKVDIVGKLEKKSASNLLTEVGRIAEDVRKKESADQDFEAIEKDLLDLLTQTLKRKTKDVLYGATLEGLYSKYYLPKEYLDGKSTVYLSNKLDFSKSNILNDGMIELVLEYDIIVDSFSIFSIKRPIQQRAVIQTAIKSEPVENKEESIWQQDNFVRGRYFINYYREDKQAYVIKTGQGLDFYNSDQQMITQLFSLNIFNNSYTSEEEDGYKIKQEDLIRKLTSYANQLDNNLIKASGQLSLDNGQIIKIPADVKKELFIVMPNEAKEFSELQSLKSYFSERGFILTFDFMENAL